MKLLDDGTCICYTKDSFSCRFCVQAKKNFTNSGDHAEMGEVSLVSCTQTLVKTQIELMTPGLQGELPNLCAIERYK